MPQNSPEVSPEDWKALRGPAANLLWRVRATEMPGVTRADRERGEGAR